MKANRETEPLKDQEDTIRKQYLRVKQLILK